MIATYPDQARFVSRACAALGLSFTDLDSGGGYLFSVSDGIHRFVSGAGRICTYPLNTAAAYGVSRDKWHTNSVLSHHGLPIIDSSLYFITDYHANLRSPGREFADAIDKVAKEAGPVFCKPNMGSGGDFAEIIRGEAAFVDYVARVRPRYDAILIQPVIDADEYRVFCVDERAYFSIRKSGRRLQGDGESDLAALISGLNAQLAGLGVSDIPEAAALENLFETRGLSRTHVLARSESVALPGRRNLAAGGVVLDLTTEVPAPLARLALRAANAIGVRIGGVDIFDASPARDLARLMVVEVNGAPAMSSLSRLGRDDLIDDIWKTVLTTYFAERAREHARTRP